MGDMESNRVMKLSAEISMYPFADEYLQPIAEFIERLSKEDGVEVKTNSMSTQLFGDYDAVMNLLGAAMKHSLASHGRAVFVTKFLAGDTRVLSGYD